MVRDRAGRTACHRLLERPQAPLCLGSQTAPSHPTSSRYRSNAESRIDLADAPFSVVGRHSGRMPGFEYSAANLRSNLTWDPATLDRYLSNPQQLVPGTLMTFPGLKNPRQRADVIAYLETLR